MIEMTLASMGNPDFGQYAPLSPRQKIAVATLKEAMDACAAYIKEYDLGGGNWPCPTVKENGKVIGRISYNGLFWTKAEWADLHAIGTKV